jgi:AraC family transcriptional regulator of adaptative response/methylated-DNA-[protein]-cysteine methyltransferase
MTTPPNILLTHRFDTPLGEMLACASPSGLCLLEFADTPADAPRLQKELNALQRLLAATIAPGANTHIQETQQQLQDYFRGVRRDFSVVLHMSGTAFQQRVWNGLLRIPYGQTVSYQEEAQAINQPSAVRAVANANGANRMSIIIPCHRVIGKNGQLVGYGGGVARKQWLLQHEQRMLATGNP